MQIFPPIMSRSSESMAESLEAIDAVVLYDTIAAGKRGLSTLARITGILEDDLVEIRPRPWRLDFLDDPTAAEHARDDIRAAHMIILSTSGSEPLPLVFKIWFATILSQKKGEHVAMVTLLGLNERSARAASGDLHFIKQIALEAELDFFAPWLDDQQSSKINREEEPLIEVAIELVEELAPNPAYSRSTSIGAPFHPRR